jgi:hypothetical protein
VDKTCIDIKIVHITTWDFGLMKAGLFADLLALSNILEILFVLVNKDEYIAAKPNPTPKRCTAHVAPVGGASKRKDMT